MSVYQSWRWTTRLYLVYERNEAQIRFGGLIVGGPSYLSQEPSRFPPFQVKIGDCYSCYPYLGARSYSMWVEINCVREYVFHR